VRCAEVNRNLGALALGGLEPEEAAEVRRHLTFCSNCQDELKEFEKVTQALRAAPPPADPPSYLKEEILSRVRDEELPLASSSNEELPSSRGSRSKNLRFVLPGIAAAALVVVVALGTFFSLQTEPPVATIQLSPTEQNEEYWGVAELHPQPSGNQQVELKLNNLDEPGPDSFYEAWFTSGEKYISAGTFTTINPGQTDVWLTAPPEVRNYSTLLITEQPTNGDPSPSEEEILKGEVP
jgi:anti-sigma-K factor RskA